MVNEFSYLMNFFQLWKEADKEDVRFEMKATFYKEIGHTLNDVVNFGTAMSLLFKLESGQMSKKDLDEYADRIDINLQEKTEKSDA